MLCLFSDLLFGVPGKHTGVSHYSKKRVVTYTITIALSTYDAGYDPHSFTHSHAYTHSENIPDRHEQRCTHILLANSGIEPTVQTYTETDR